MTPRQFALRSARHVYDLVLGPLRPVTVSVRMLLVKEGATLLIHHTYASKWYFPGGGVKPGETLWEAAIREAWEETGAIVRDEPWLLGIYHYQVAGRNDHVVVYVSEDFDLMPPPPSWEIEGRAWFDLDNLPPDIVDSCRRRVGEYLAGAAPYFGMW